MLRLPRSPLTSLDALLEKGWSWLLSQLCRVTGRSNFSFARAFAKVGGFLLANSFLVLGMIELEAADIFDGVISSFMLFNTIRYVQRVHKMSRRLEKAAENGETHIDTSLKEVEYLHKIRLLLFVFAIAACLILPAWLLGVPMIILAGSMYFVFDFRPRKKSELRQGIESAGRRAKKLKLPLPVPAPRTTPT